VDGQAKRELISHIQNHVNYPTTKKALVEEGSNMAHVPEPTRQWAVEKPPDALRRFLDGDPREGRLIVLAGMGRNGGGALAAARHLTSWGAKVQAFVTQPANKFVPVSAHQLDIINRLQVSGCATGVRHVFGLTRVGNGRRSVPAAGERYGERSLRQNAAMQNFDAHPCAAGA
jgi:hypothetical protein